jgi:hypothetical protein
MQPDDVDAQLLAHEILIGLLATRLQERDPRFIAGLRRDFDTVLGELAAKGHKADPFAVKCRAAMMTVLDDIEMHATRKSAARRVTLRRRFLNWLEKG